MIGRAIKADNGFQKTRSFPTGHQLVRQPRITQRNADFGLIDNLAQFSGTKHRH